MQQGFTFKEVADQYMASNEGIDKSWQESAQDALNSMVLPRWQNKPIMEVTRAHGVQLLQDVLTKAPDRVATVESVIRLIFNFAVGEGHIRANPMQGFIKIVVDEATPTPTPTPTSTPTSTPTHTHTHTRSRSRCQPTFGL